MERLGERAVGSKGALVFVVPSSPSPWLELGFRDMVV